MCHAYTKLATQLDNAGAASTTMGALLQHMLPHLDGRVQQRAQSHRAKGKEDDGHLALRMQQSLRWSERRCIATAVALQC